MAKPFWNSEKILSASALLISLTTLIVFIYQTKLIRKQQYMSVYPYLDLQNGGGGTLQYIFQLSNEGIGPAIVQDIEIKAPNGKEYTDFIDYVDDVVEEKDSIWYLYSSVKPGRLIPAEEKIPLIQLVTKELLKNQGYYEYYDTPNTLEGSVKLYQILNHDSLQVKIVYQSIYGEEWSITNKSNSPTKH